MEQCGCQLAFVVHRSAPYGLLGNADRAGAILALGTRRCQANLFFELLRLSVRLAPSPGVDSFN